MKKNVLLLVLFSAILLILNWSAFTSFLSQDDFFHLNAVAGKSINEIPGFFISKQSNYDFYRPLSRETYSLLMLKLFGLNALVFHIVNFLLIITNGVIVFLLTKLLFKKEVTARFAALIFFLSAVHNVDLYYISSVQNLLTATFIDTSVYLYLKYLEKRQILSYFFAIIFTILGLLSHESAVVFLPIIITAHLIIKNKEKIILLIPFFVIAVIYFLGTNLNSALPNQTVYHPVFGIKSTLNNLVWYLLWSFGLSEILPDFVTPIANSLTGFKLPINPNFIKWYPLYAVSVFVLLLFMFLMLTLIIYKLRKNKINKKVLLPVCAFLFSTSPFLFFPQHKFVYYLTLPIIWFSVFLGSILGTVWDGKKNLKFTAPLFVIIFFIVSYQTISLNKLTFWAAKRAAAAKVILTDFHQKYPIKPNTPIEIVNDPDYPKIADLWGSSSKQAFYILSGSDAFQLLYNDKSLKVYFQDVNAQNMESGQKTLLYMAKFPY